MKRYKKIFTYSIPFIIVLNGYASGIAGLSLGGIMINAYNVFAALLFLKNRKKIDGFFARTVGLLSFFGVLSCFGFLLYGIHSPTSILAGILKILTWFMGVTFTAKVLFDFELFKRVFRRFCIVCTTYLFVQMIAWNGIRLYLPNLFELGILKPLYEQYSATSYINYLTAIGFGRFSSFLAEPAYYGILMTIDLVIVFFDIYYPNGLTTKGKMEAVFLILGIWVSTSTAAIVFAIFIILVYFFRVNIKDKLLITIAVTCIGGVVFFAQSTNSLINFFLEKITTIGSSGRVGGSYSELRNLSGLQKLIGVGLNNEGVITNTSYFNMFTGLIIEYGILGFSCFIVYMCKLYFDKNCLALHVLLIIYLAAMFQGGYLFNLYGILFFLVALNLNKTSGYARKKQGASNTN